MRSVESALSPSTLLLAQNRLLLELCGGSNKDDLEWRCRFGGRTGGFGGRLNSRLTRRPLLFHKPCFHVFINEPVGNKDLFKKEVFFCLNKNSNHVAHE